MIEVDTVRCTQEKDSQDAPSLTSLQQLRVIRRNGEVVAFQVEKIALAMTKAFLAVEGQHLLTANVSPRIQALVSQLSNDIAAVFQRRLGETATVHIEDIQDQVELMLMRAGEQKVARAYVLYREARKNARAHKAAMGEDVQTLIHVTLDDGLRIPLDFSTVQTTLNMACEGIESVEPGLIFNALQRSIFDGLTVQELRKAMILSARMLIETEPNYTYVTARILLEELYLEGLSALNLPLAPVQGTLDKQAMKTMYVNYFPHYMEKGLASGLLSPALEKFDYAFLANALLPERDLSFTYLGLQTLYDRYFLHENKVRFELPQAFFMRVAMGLALEEKDFNEKAVEFYLLLSSFDYMSSTPTLFNAGTRHSQLSSCYLTTIPDTLDGIYGSIRDNALLQKYAGGIGNDWTFVRAMGALIKGTNGQSLGPIPFMVVANATAVAVNQGGKRKGAVCGYLETFHRSIKEFLELRKNTGDERWRTHDMNTANWIPDLFMKRVCEKAEWTLFSPDEAPDLHELYGEAFETAYVAYEEKARRGEIKNTEVIAAETLWRKMLGLLYETGHPWITFKDPCNIRSPQRHVGTIHSSNLCTEITLNTSADEIAVCNLGSINLPQHVVNGKLDRKKLKETICLAVRMLDNVIDVNYYPVPQARNANMRHRPIGLGIMGFQDVLYLLGMSYASEEAVHFADELMELISYYAIEASVLLAEERGSYETFEGSLWSQGILPIDSIDLLEKERGKEYLVLDRTQRLDWDSLRERVKKSGMRNSNVMAIAPTATIANIVGVSQSIEPTYQNLYVKSNLSGEFTVVNPYLVQELKQLDLWDPTMVNDLKYYDGSVQSIARIPADVRARYATAFEIDPTWLVEAAARRQKWIDQAQSLNLYMAAASGKKLDALYRLAWIRGLKTTYYLRSLGATSAEKSTLHDGALNAVPAAPKACSILDPDCEACQ